MSADTHPQVTPGPALGPTHPGPTDWGMELGGLTHPSLAELGTEGGEQLVLKSPHLVAGRGWGWPLSKTPQWDGLRHRRETEAVCVEGHSRGYLDRGTGGYWGFVRGLRPWVSGNSRASWALSNRARGGEEGEEGEQ